MGLRDEQNPKLHQIAEQSKADVFLDNFASKTVEGKTTMDLIKFCPNLAVHLSDLKREHQLQMEKANAPIVA